MTRQIGAFELQDPLPVLRRPRLLMALSPWIDVGAVASGTLTFLGQAWDAEPLGQLSRPGDFYDFTRYRPNLVRSGGQRLIVTPNTSLHWAQSPSGEHWLFLHALEPHAHAEQYLDSLAELMGFLEVAQYCLIGSFYGPAPHTRPLVVFGDASNISLQERIAELGVRESSYEGPTSILAAVTDQAEAAGIESLRLVLQLPAYAQLEQDYRGLLTTLQLLSAIYGLDLELDALRQEADRQAAAVDEAVAADPRLQRWVREMEANYDAAIPAGSDEPAAQLSPQLENFLRDVQRSWNDPESN